MNLQTITSNEMRLFYFHLIKNGYGEENRNISPSTIFFNEPSAFDAAATKIASESLDILVSEPTALPAPIVKVCFSLAKSEPNRNWGGVNQNNGS